MKRPPVDGTRRRIVTLAGSGLLLAAAPALSSLARAR
jgi:hypothetical protein